MLGQSVDAGSLLAAVDCANKSGRPTYSAVCFYLKLQKESLNTVDDSQLDGLTVDHADLALYDALLHSKGDGHD